MLQGHLCYKVRKNKKETNQVKIYKAMLKHLPNDHSDHYENEMSRSGAIFFALAHK